MTTRQEAVAKMGITLCAHRIDGELCGQQAVAAVKLEETPVEHVDGLEPRGHKGWDFACHYLPVCQQHIAAYPDHDGFDFRAGP